MKKQFRVLLILIFILVPFSEAKMSVVVAPAADAGRAVINCHDCGACAYDIQWSECADGKQYSSFVKLIECTGDYTPPTQRNCSVPKQPDPLPLCLESNVIYGDWTPCVNNISIRAADKKGVTCAGGFIPATQKNCENNQPVSQELNSSVATTTNSNYISRPFSGRIGDENPIITKTQTLTKEDIQFATKLKGTILLQVESKGEGWYVNPGDMKKYYLGRPTDAFNIMKKLGLGIKHDELAGYNNLKFPSRLSGKIVLDVEQNGEAYYVNPKDLRGYFLNRPSDAFKIMIELGLGITNSDITKIAEGEVR